MQISVAIVPRRRPAPTRAVARGPKNGSSEWRTTWIAVLIAYARSVHVGRHVALPRHAGVVHRAGMARVVPIEAQRVPSDSRTSALP